MKKFSDVEDEYIRLAERPIDFVGILTKYLSYWKWFLISFIICMAIAAIYIAFTLPQYRISTSILFKDEERGGGMSESSLFNERGILTQRNNVDNEIEILTRSLIVEDVVMKLGLYAKYTEIAPFGFSQNKSYNKAPLRFTYREKNILYGNEIPIQISMLEEDIYKIQKKIVFFVRARPDGYFEIYGKHNGNKYDVNVRPSDSNVDLPFGKISIKRGDFIPTEVMIMKIELNNPVGVADNYLGNLDIELTSLNSSVANLSLKAQNGNMGKDFIKTYIEFYNEEGIRIKNELADKTARLIDMHLVNLNNDLSSVESQAQDYMQARGLTDIASQADLYNSQSANMGQRRMEIETQFSMVSNLYDYIMQNNNNQLLPANSGINSVALNSQISSYNDLVLQRNRLSRIASSSNQAMIDLNNQIETMLYSIRSGLLNEKNNLEIQLRELSNVYNQNNARLHAIPRQEREYSDIVRQQNIKEELFVYLLQRKEERYMNMASVEPNIRFVDNIRLMGVVSPNKLLIGLIFFVLALILPIAVIKIKDLLNYKIKNREELESASDIIPILGEIPKTTHSSQVVVSENNNDSFNEMIRLLRANLMFVMDNKSIKVINMLSSISNEGKTFTAINLAMSMALIDKKVLVIELDIRKPKLSKYLSVENNEGISMYLSGSLNKEKLVKPSGAHPNLYVITAGKTPPNPNELLTKSILDDLINDLRNDFDYIIIDTAPLGVVSDSLLLNRLADINLYIVRSDFTPKRYIEDAVEHFHENRLRRMYFILNSIDINKMPYRYGYSKKYSYGYN